MKTLKLVGRATGGLVMDGVAGLAGFCMFGGMFTFVAQDEAVIAVGVAVGIVGAVAMLILKRVMDLDLADLKKRLALDMAALEARIAADRVANLEKQIADKEEQDAKDAAHARQMAELFGGLETVESGEVSDPFDDDEEQVFTAEEQEDIAVFKGFEASLKGK